MEIITSKEYLLSIDTETNPATNLRPATTANYRSVACLISNGLDGSAAAQEYTNKCSDGAAQSAPGIISYTISANGQAFSLTEDELEAQTNYDELLRLFNSQSVFFALLRRPVIGGTGLVYREAKVWINSFTESGENEAPLTFDVSLTITGKLFLDPVTP